MPPMIWLYVSYPSSYKYCNSLINISKNSFMSLPRVRGSGINMASRLKGNFIYFQSGKFYGNTIMGHIFYVVLRLSYVLNPSIASPSLTFCEPATMDIHDKNVSMHLYLMDVSWHHRRSCFPPYAIACQKQYASTWTIVTIMA